MMAQPQSAYGANRIRASTARPRFGARTRRFEAGFGRSHGWRRPKCRLRRSGRPVGRDEGTREAGGLPGEKTFGVICRRERVFPKSLAPARRAGETPSRARPSRPAWQSHANQERGRVSALRQTTKKTAAQGLRFFYWLNLLAPDANKANRPYARRQLVLPALSSSTIPISVRRLRAASAAAQFLSARA